MANNNKSVSNNKKSGSIFDMCSPALLYLIFGVLSIIGMIFSNSKVSSILFQSIFVFFWTWILNYICRSGHTGISWFLVILPFVFLAIGVFALAKNLSPQEIKEIIKNSDNQ
jgi:hypothetical protein